MDIDTLGNIIVWCYAGGATAIIATVGIATYISDKNSKKIAPVLDKQYGPKISANLASLEEAVKAGDNEKAKGLLKERSAILDELKTIRENYLGYASQEVKQSVTKGASLEAYLKA
ncbi:MAG: hypothetical protein WC852_06555 [Candidatus Nanoarchaeia archaeon]|jgi:hypothetical protein